MAGYARLPLVCTNATRLLHCEQTTLSVRVIAIVPTPEKAEALRRKKEHEARAKGRKLSEQARFLAGFILLVTTLPLPQWPTALVIELYAWSFHIEVLFKRIKQLVDLHTLRCCWSPGCSLRRTSKACDASSAPGEPFAVALSTWQLAHLALESLQQVVKGWYSLQQLRAGLPEFRRLFRERRRRPLLEHQRRHRFHSLLALDTDPAALFSGSGP